MAVLGQNGYSGGQNGEFFEGFLLFFKDQKLSFYEQKLITNCGEIGQNGRFGTVFGPNVENKIFSQKSENVTSIHL